jgi:ABC-type lipopolysaccharide export system ATPase subunit
MVVKGVTLYVRRGEAVGLLGPNGAGKTTVFYMITGLINADRGRIELMASMSPRCRCISVPGLVSVFAAGSLDISRS